MRRINIFKSCLLLFTLGGAFVLTPIFALEGADANNLADQIESLNQQIEDIANSEDNLYEQGMSYIDANPSMNSDCLEKLDQNFSGLLFQYKPNNIAWNKFDRIKSSKISPDDLDQLQELLDTMQQERDDLNNLLGQIQALVQSIQQGNDQCSDYVPITTEYNYIVYDYSYPDYDYSAYAIYPWAIGFGLGWGWGGWGWWNGGGWRNHGHHRHGHHHHRGHHGRHGRHGGHRGHHGGHHGGGHHGGGHHGGGHHGGGHHGGGHHGGGHHGGGHHGGGHHGGGHGGGHHR